jgi:hypothetical protein
LGKPALQASTANGIRHTSMEGVHSYPIGVTAYFFENSCIRIGGYFLRHNLNPQDICRKSNEAAK